MYFHDTNRAKNTNNYYHFYVSVIENEKLFSFIFLSKKNTFFKIFILLNNNKTESTKFIYWAWNETMYLYPLQNSSQYYSICAIKKTTYFCFEQNKTEKKYFCKIISSFGSVASESLWSVCGVLFCFFFQILLLLLFYIKQWTKQNCFFCLHCIFSFFKENEAK